MRCQECGKELTNEKDAYGHDCEAPDLNRVRIKIAGKSGTLFKNEGLWIADDHKGRLKEMVE